MYIDCGLWYDKHKKPRQRRRTFERENKSFGLCPHGGAAFVRLWAEERNGGCTVIQNSRITLSGDNGRRICYQLSALKGNTLDVSLGYGIASTKEVSGNTIRGRIRHKVFQDCSGVENNNVEVRRFSILG